MLCPLQSSGHSFGVVVRELAPAAGSEEGALSFPPQLLTVCPVGSGRCHPTPIANCVPCGLRALPSPRAACGDAGMRGAHGARTARAVPGLNSARAAPLPLSPSVSLALGLSLSCVVFHLPERIQRFPWTAARLCACCR